MGRGGKVMRNGLSWKMGILLGVIFCAGSLSLTATVDPSSLFYPLGVNAGAVFAPRNNPAALGKALGLSLGCRIENRYAISEWTEAGLSATWGQGNNGLGLDFCQKGPAFYREQELGLAYGRGIGNTLQAGVRMRCRSTSIPEMNIQYYTLAFDFGLRARFSKKLVFSAMTRDPFSIQGAEVSSVSSGLEFGVQYEPDPKWALSLEFIKPPALMPCLTVGIGLRPSSRSMAWLRYFTKPWKFEVGWGIEWGKMQIYSFAGYHAVLGVSPGLAFFWSF